jgi:hypothetical protein
MVFYYPELKHIYTTFLSSAQATIQLSSIDTFPFVFKKSDLGIIFYLNIEEYYKLGVHPSVGAK